MTDGILKGAAMAAAACLAAGCDTQQQPAQPAEPANTAAAATTEAPLARAAADPGLQWGACPTFPAGCEVAVLHGDPAKPNADVLLRVPAGYAIPPHTHSSEERMVLVAGRMQVKYQGHPEAMLEPGSYAYGPAGMPHSGNCAAGAQCILFVAFEAPLDVKPYSGTL